MPQYDYNSGLATQLLDDGGYVDTDSDGIRNGPATGDNLNFELIVRSSWTNEVKICTLIKEELANIGIGITVVSLDVSTLYDYIYAPTESLFDILA